MLTLLVLTAVLGSADGSSDTRDEAIAAARKALVRREGHKDAPAEVVSADAVEWSDSSLGCPEKGKLYAQALTRGYRVVLREGRTVHVVHVSGADAVVCGKPLAIAEQQPEAAPDTHEAEAPEPVDPARRALVAQAREDLARRLSIEPDAVGFVKLKEVVWPDRSFGCPRPGMMYPQIPQDGVLIVLRAAGRSYDYHGGAGRAPFLCPKPEAKEVR
jgi:hypothetical protein